MFVHEDGDILGVVIGGLIDVHIVVVLAVCQRDKKGQDKAGKAMGFGGFRVFCGYPLPVVIQRGWPRQRAGKRGTHEQRLLAALYPFGMKMLRRQQCLATMTG